MPLTAPYVASQAVDRHKQAAANDKAAEMERDRCHLFAPPLCVFLFARPLYCHIVCRANLQYLAAQRRSYR